VHIKRYSANSSGFPCFSDFFSIIFRTPSRENACKFYKRNKNHRNSNSLECPLPFYLPSHMFTKDMKQFLKALHHRYQNRELRARESNFIEVNMQLTDAYLVLN